MKRVIPRGESPDRNFDHGSRLADNCILYYHLASLSNDYVMRVTPHYLSNVYARGSWL